MESGEAPSRKDSKGQYELDNAHQGIREFYRGTGDDDKNEFAGIQPGSVSQGRDLYNREDDFGRMGEPYGWESYTNAPSTENGPADLSNVRGMRTEGGPTEGNE